MLVESPSVELSKIHVETEARPSIPNLDDQINAVKDLRVTFYHMRIRSFVRWHSGIASRPLKRWIILGFISLMLVSGFLFTSKESQSIVCVSFTIGNSALSFLVVFAVVLAVYIVALLLSYVWVAIIWILLFELLVIIFVGSFSSSAAWEKHRWIFLLIIILEGLTFLGAIFYYFLFVRFIKQPRINKALWKLVDNGDVLSYENRFALRGCCRRRKGTCQYIGTLDSSGKPHGKGLWYDSAGETLDGYWSHGIPSGAFFSVESESRGFATEARALMYYLARDEEVDEMFMFPRNKSSPRFGVSLTECSVSGGFFLNLPGWVSIEGPHFLESGKFRSCFKALGAYNGGTAPANISIRLTSKKVVNAVPAEVVIFIHGFNTPCSFQLQAVGQLLCMGRFPSHVKTVLFSWSSGKVPTYFSALEAASSEILHQQFIDLLVALKETGSTNFHILCHSMANDVVHESLSFSSITIVQGDFPMDQFLETGYVALKKLTSKLTVFVNENDGALYWRSKFSKTEESPMGYRIEAFRNAEGSYLDLDVIDTSYIDINVNKTRHSSFNLNPSIVNDLRELIVSKKRAKNRGGLILRKGNVFAYCQAPSYVLS